MVQELPHTASILEVENMQMMEWLKESIQDQRRFLEDTLRQPLQDLGRRCVRVWFSHDRLDEVLSEGIATVSTTSLVYAVNTSGIQVSSNIYRNRVDESAKGQDLSSRPYMLESMPSSGLVLSDVYLSRVTSRPCITVFHPVVSKGSALGFIAADFELRRLPAVQIPRSQSSGWRQIRGDPVIRSTLFSQERIASHLDAQVDDVVSIVEELICERGVFHAKIHFSGSRTTLWRVDQPHHFRVHVLDEILNPSVCLAYPTMLYPDEAVVPRSWVRRILEKFSVLRFIDDTIYLRSGSLNVINGMVGLTFSCDGTHYMMADDFLEKGLGFWSVEEPESGCQAFSAGA